MLLLRIFLGCCLLACMYTTSAQSGFVSAGGSGSGAEGNVSFSVGQIDFSILGNNSNAGLQQVFIYGPFPLSSLTFTGKKSGTAALLQWETMAELNVSHYIVERSTDRIHFNEQIGTVQSKGNSVQNNYSFTDNQPHNGINYYRLQVVDKNSNVTYSTIVAIAFSETGVTVYPNPVTSLLRINIGSGSFFGWSYRLLDLSGKLVLSSAIGSQSSNIDMSRLQAGIYLLQVNSLQGSSTFNIIKQ